MSPITNATRYEKPPPVDLHCPACQADLTVQDSVTFIQRYPSYWADAPRNLRGYLGQNYSGQVGIYTRSNLYASFDRATCATCGEKFSPGEDFNAVRNYRRYY